MAWDLGDYKEVSERLADLFAAFPEASMRGNYEFVQGGVVYRAECFRFPDDPAPGVGTAWEEMPGKTTYTKGSELQNAETSAWGRAIVAVGASTSKKVASANEMRSAQARQQSSPAPRERAGAAGTAGSLPAPPAVPASPNQLQHLQSKMKRLLADHVKVADRRIAAGLPKLDKDCSAEDLAGWVTLLQEIEGELEAPFPVENYVSN